MSKKHNALETSLQQIENVLREAAHSACAKHDPYLVWQLINQSHAVQRMTKRIVENVDRATAAPTY